MLSCPRSLETPYETESQHESVAFFVPSAHVQVEVHPTVIQAGSRLIQYPSGEYACRSRTVSSSRPFLRSAKAE